MIKPVDNAVAEIAAVIQRIAVAISKVARIYVRCQGQRRKAIAGDTDNAGITVAVGRQDFCDRKNFSIFVCCNQAAILDLSPGFDDMIACCHCAITAYAIASRDVHMPIVAFVA